MGQLERYGLYVLVVVIFLILGVAIWGGEPQASTSTDLAAFHDAGAPVARTATAPSSIVIDDMFEDAESAFDELPARPADTQRVDDDVAEAPEVAADERRSPRTAPPESGGESAVTPPVAAAWPKQHTVQRGEVYETIALRYYGARTAWKRIAEANGVAPKELRAGQVLSIPAPPAAAGAEGTAAPVSGGGEYLVRPGDNPAKISKSRFGTEKYAREIMELNGISDPTKLMPGKTIRLPVVAGTDRRE